MGERGALLTTRPVDPLNYPPRGLSWLPAPCPVDPAPARLSKKRGGGNNSAKNAAGDNKSCGRAGVCVECLDLYARTTHAIGAASAIFAAARSASTTGPFMGHSEAPLHALRAAATAVWAPVPSVEHGTGRPRGEEKKHLAVLHQ